MNRVSTSHNRWLVTIWINLLRSFFAGIVVGIVMAATGEPLGQVIMMPFVLPLIYFPILLPIGLITFAISNRPGEYAGLFRLINFVVGLTIVPGDPFVYLLHKSFPHVVPVDFYPPFNWQLIVLVS